MSVLKTSPAFACASARSSIKRVAQVAAVAIALLLPATAVAAPVTLKLSFITSDRSNIYQCYVKPFVDAVNADGAGIVQIKVYFSGAISPAMTEQARLVSMVSLIWPTSYQAIRQSNSQTFRSWNCPACSGMNASRASSSRGWPPPGLSKGTESFLWSAPL